MKFEYDLDVAHEPAFRQFTSDKKGVVQIEHTLGPAAARLPIVDDNLSSLEIFSSKYRFLFIYIADASDEDHLFGG